MTQDRGEGGRFSEQVRLDDVLAVFETANVPVLTSREVADELGCSRPTAYIKLEELVERGDVQKKEVGARAVVYIRLSE